MTGPPERNLKGHISKCGWWMHRSMKRRMSWFGGSKLSLFWKVKAAKAAKAQSQVVLAVPALDGQGSMAFQAQNCPRNWATRARLCGSLEKLERSDLEMDGKRLGRAMVHGPICNASMLVVQCCTMLCNVVQYCTNSERRWLCSDVFCLEHRVIISSAAWGFRLCHWWQVLARKLWRTVGEARAVTNTLPVHWGQGDTSLAVCCVQLEIFGFT